MMCRINAYENLRITMKLFLESDKIGRDIKISQVKYMRLACPNFHYKQIASKQTCVWGFNPLDPNPAVAARAVCPQSGRSRPEKRPFFHIFPHFSKIEQSKKVLPHIGVQYISN